MGKKNGMNYRHVRRVLVMVFFLTTCLIAMVIHLGYIQVVSSDNYKGIDLVSKSIEQRSRNVLLDIGRGDILARDNRSITGKEKLAILLLPRRPEMLELEIQKLSELARIVDVNEQQLVDIVKNIQYPQLLEINQQLVEVGDQQKQKVLDLNLSGSILIQAKERYPAGMIAKHVVGFIGEDPVLINNNFDAYVQSGVYRVTDIVGKTGLERTFEREVKSEGATYLSYYIYQDSDLHLHPFYGLGMNIQASPNKHRPINSITTLDYDLQMYTEELLDQYNVKKGSIVILDIHNGDIVAMASRPDFDPNQIQMHEYENTRNLAVTASFPGSVFKTVITLGVLEEGIATIHDQYNCNGRYEFTNGQQLQCWKEHGNLTLIRAFAESCNATFANLAIQLGRENIIIYANELGLGEKVGYYDSIMDQPQLYLEDQGIIFQVEGHNQQLLANTGLGQQDVRITPLQAANMMATIANFGKKFEPRIVSELQSKSGHSLRKFLPQATNTANSSRHTYYEMQKLLAAVVEQGTASQLSAQGISAAGKTGTAELGKTGKVNRWFAGYFPNKYPEYSVAVVIEDVSSWEKVSTTTNIFRDIVRFTFDE